MVHKEQELLQIDEQFIRQLLEKDPGALAGLSINLANDLKEAMECLNQNSSNSSKPSDSLAPWDKGSRDEDDDEELNIAERDAFRSASDKGRLPDDISDISAEESCPPLENSEEKRKPGRQPGIVAALKRGNQRITREFKQNTQKS